MENTNSGEFKNILDMLKEKAESTIPETEIEAQTTETVSHSDEDIKNMLRQQFAAYDIKPREVGDDYCVNIDDFTRTGEIITAEQDEKNEEQEAILVECEKISETTYEQNVMEELYTQEESEPEELSEKVASAEEEMPQNDVNEAVDEIIREIFEEAEETAEQTVEEMSAEELYKHQDDIVLGEAITTEETKAFNATQDISEKTDNEPSSIEEEQIVVEEDNIEDDEIQSSESVNYDDVLEGQQGTVFNRFVEDFSGDLDDVVFEAEITESRAPDKQYTIFEDWEQLMRDKQYEAAEDGIIPPTKEELEYSAEIAARAARGNTDYFTPITETTRDIDAVDIALMVALGGEDELNQTVGFEKIRQAVNSVEGDEGVSLEDKNIYGYCDEEYRSLSQNMRIRNQYKTDKRRTLTKMIATALITVMLLCYEIAGWMGFDLGNVINGQRTPVLQVLIGLQLLVVGIAISSSKLKMFFKNMLEFSSLSYVGAIIVSLLSILHDILILTIEYAAAGATVHSLASILLLLSLIYDVFDVCQQASAFDIVSKNDRKLVLEPYGKLRMGDDESTGDVIDKDSYCISRVSSVNKYFERTSRSSPNITGKLISLVLSFSVSLCVMLVLLLTGENIGTIVLSLIVTLSFSLICASIFESEFAFFVAHRILKKYKTAMVGKTSVAEYGKCNILYFDDYNVFNKKSVRTKGLKLYDNNEIYRILYHTQAVFSKVGGPLKSVFEFATSEMVHSRSVDIREISREGISAVVDKRTSVLIGTGNYMKLKGIHPSYTSADLKLEETGEDSIMFIALNGTLGAKLYVTYQFSSEFERLAKQLATCGINIGIRSSDPNLNNKWAKAYSKAKKCYISIVRPTLKEIRPTDKSIESGLVSIKNVRALSEAIMLCTRLDAFESLIGKIRVAAIALLGLLTFVLVYVSGINAVSMLLLMLACALGTSVMMLLSHFYIKR